MRLNTWIVARCNWRKLYYSRLASHVLCVHALDVPEEQEGSRKGVSHLDSFLSLGSWSTRQSDAATQSTKSNSCRKSNTSIPSCNYTLLQKTANTLLLADFARYLCFKWHALCMYRDCCISYSSSSLLTNKNIARTFSNCKVCWSSLVGRLIVLRVRRYRLEIWLLQSSSLWP